MANKNYYDEKKATSMLLEYQKIVETIKDEKGHKIVINKTPYIEKLETEITLEVLKVVKAIIFVYRYDRFLEYDELESLGIMACFQNYLKYDPQHGSSFNFFSLIVKKCLYGVTTRNSKKKAHNVALEELGDAVHSPKISNIDEFIDNLHITLIDIIDSNYLRKKRAKLTLITNVICDYLRKTRVYVSKTDLYKFCGIYGLRASDIRDYVRIMKNYYVDLKLLIDFFEEDNKEETVSSTNAIEE